MAKDVKVESCQCVEKNLPYIKKRTLYILSEEYLKGKELPNISAGARKMTISESGRIVTMHNYNLELISVQDIVNVFDKCNYDIMPLSDESNIFDRIKSLLYGIGVIRGVETEKVDIEYFFRYDMEKLKDLDDPKGFDEGILEQVADLIGVSCNILRGIPLDKDLAKSYMHSMIALEEKELQRQAQAQNKEKASNAKSKSVHRLSQRDDISSYLKWLRTLSINERDLQIRDLKRQDLLNLLRYLI